MYGNTKQRKERNYFASLKFIQSIGGNLPPLKSNSMKYLKLKWLWAVEVNGIQWNSFRLKTDANKYAKDNNGIVIRKQLITDKY